MDYTNIIGMVAATLTTLAFIPQAVKVIKTKHTKDLSLFMYIFFTLGLLLWLVFGILMKSLPIIMANGVTIVFAVVILGMKIKYK